MQRAAIILAVGVAGVACRPESRRVDLTMRPAAAPAADDEPLAPADRRVQVVVRDQTMAGIAQSLLGKRCRVQLRRDALGMAAPGSTTLHGRWASQSSIDGTVVELTDQWLVIVATGDRRYFVPHGSILVVEVQE